MAHEAHPSRQSTAHCRSRISRETQAGTHSGACQRCGCVKLVQWLPKNDQVERTENEQGGAQQALRLTMSAEWRRSGWLSAPLLPSRRHGRQQRRIERVALRSASSSKRDTQRRVQRCSWRAGDAPVASAAVEHRRGRTARDARQVESGLEGERVGGQERVERERKGASGQRAAAEAQAGRLQLAQVRCGARGQWQLVRFRVGKGRKPPKSAESKSGAYPARASARRGFARRARRGAAPARRSAACGGRSARLGRGPRGAREVTAKEGLGCPQGFAAHAQAARTCGGSPSSADACRTAASAGAAGSASGLPPGKLRAQGSRNRSTGQR